MRRISQFSYPSYPVAIRANKASYTVALGIFHCMDAMKMRQWVTALVVLLSLDKTVQKSK
jgi:hypothetical protein